MPTSSTQSNSLRHYRRKSVMDTFPSTGKNAMRVQHAAELACFVTLSIRPNSWTLRHSYILWQRCQKQPWTMTCGPKTVWSAFIAADSKVTDDRRRICALRQSCGSLSNYVYVQLTKQRTTHHCQPYSFQDYLQQEGWLSPTELV